MALLSLVHRKVYQLCRVQIVEGLDIKNIIDHLVGKLILTPIDEEHIQSKTTNREKIKALLEMLPRKGEEGYTMFMEVLKDKQPSLYEELAKCERKQNGGSQQQDQCNCKYIMTMHAIMCDICIVY